MDMINFSALEDFRNARRQAALEEILGRLTGKPTALLPYDEVRQKLKANATGQSELREIPLDAIVGSVGRYSDFTRSFLPRRNADGQRWARVESAFTDPAGLEPILVYQIGDVYFVRDGNHRVSVARQLGATHITAYVTEVPTRVPLSADTRPDDLILKAEYAEFLEHTHLDELRPMANLIVTAPGRYQVLEEHIQVHRYYMGLEQKRDISFPEAAAHWYDTVYEPIARVIRSLGILRDFPGRTETDLYVWISEHRAALEQELGWGVGPAAAASDWAKQFSPRPRRVVSRVGARLRDAMVPDEFSQGPAPGEWRQEQLAEGQEECLFGDILVPINGQEVGWRALEQASIANRCNEGRLLGLYVVASQAEAESNQTRTIRDEFDRRCQAAGRKGHLAIEVGRISRKICEWSRWTDLIVASLAHPPEPRPVAKLRSGFRMMIQRCWVPVLAVPDMPSPMDRALLAYDGSLKANEALYVAAYLAARWGASLAVLTVTEKNRVTGETLAGARHYLETQGVQAIYREESGPAARAILRTAEEQASNVIVMGGYRFSSLREAVQGSPLNEVLRESRQPILICR